MLLSISKMKITFKNVGQGDSIILEWSEHEKLHYGIIDCNTTKNGTNPVLEFFKSNSTKEVFFIILSHPHFDHFSGFPDLLSYFRDKNIKIRYFFHTSRNVPEYLKAACKSGEASTKLGKLFNLLRKLYNEELIQFLNSIEYSPFNDLELNSNWSLKVLSPSLTENDSFVRNALPLYQEEDSNNNPNANYLCTVLKLFNKETKEFILFTSDAEAKTFKRLKSNETDWKNEGEQIILGQIPHHGSYRNHYSNFWKNLPLSRSRTDLAVSVGENGYNHPSQKVIDFFHRSGVKINATNLVGCLNPNKISEEGVRNEIALDSFSSPLNYSPQGKDLVFTF